MRTSILGRPRPLPGHRRADRPPRHLAANYILNWEEPDYYSYRICDEVVNAACLAISAPWSQVMVRLNDTGSAVIASRLATSTCSAHLTTQPQLVDEQRVGLAFVADCQASVHGGTTVGVAHGATAPGRASITQAVAHAARAASTGSSRSGVEDAAVSLVLDQSMAAVLQARFRLGRL